MPIPATNPVVNIPIVTPFDAVDRVDHDALARNMERWLSTSATGFLVGSQTGEEWYLSEEEKLAVARTVKDNLGERGFLMGGIDCPSVTETLRVETPRTVKALPIDFSSAAAQWETASRFLRDEFATGE